MEKKDNVQERSFHISHPDQWPDSYHKEQQLWKASRACLGHFNNTVEQKTKQSSIITQEEEEITSFLPRRNVPAGKSSSSHTERKSAALGKGPASVEPGLAESSKEEKQNCN